MHSRAWGTILLCATSACAFDARPFEATEGGHQGDASGGESDGSGDADGSGDGDGGGDGDGDGDPKLWLEISVADGSCADLALVDRESYAVRFDVHSEPQQSVELWASHDSCSPEPFVYQQLDTDETGHARHELWHEGSLDCSENLLGEWSVWAVHGTMATPSETIAFRNSQCPDLQSCALTHAYCPADAPMPPFIDRQDLFVLTPEERVVFTPPPNWLDWGTNWEDYPLRELWEAFDAGDYPTPLDPAAGPAGWFEPDGTGSQNHGPLWYGEIALAAALEEDIELFETAAQLDLELLALDSLQGHMRHEAVGQYAGFWEGSVAMMALAGLYAPPEADLGPELLAASRGWWADHVAVLRTLSVADGQVALIGARLPGVEGEDSWASLSAAINLQLADPRPYDQLHPTIAQFLSPDGEPQAVDNGVPVRWYRPRAVAERWVVLRAIQSGAFLPVAPNHPPPSVVSDVYRWEDEEVVRTASPVVLGYPPSRFQVRWAPGQVIEIEIGQPVGTNGGKGPHASPHAILVPDDAELILGR